MREGPWLLKPGGLSIKLLARRGIKGSCRGNSDLVFRLSADHKSLLEKDLEYLAERPADRSWRFNARAGWSPRLVLLDVLRHAGVAQLVEHQPSKFSRFLTSQAQ